MFDRKSGDVGFFECIAVSSPQKEQWQLWWMDWVSDVIAQICAFFPKSTAIRSNGNFSSLTAQGRVKNPPFNAAQRNVILCAKSVFPRYWSSILFLWTSAQISRDIANHSFICTIPLPSFQPHYRYDFLQVISRCVVILWVPFRCHVKTMHSSCSNINHIRYVLFYLKKINLKKLILFFS